MMWVFAWLVAVASARQTSFDVQKQGDQHVVEMAWNMGKKERHEVRFSLPASSVGDDLDQKLKLSKKELGADVVVSLRSWAETSGPKGVKLTFSSNKSGEIGISASGKDRSKVKDALDAASDARDEAVERWLRQHDYTRLDDGDIVPDHAGLVADYAGDLAPVATALGRQGSARDFVRLALGMVQNIPYEAGKNGNDRGYRRPLSVLVKNRGDCDSKAVLMLGLVRAAWPSVPGVVVYIKDHAFIGLGIEPERGDKTRKIDGITYVMMEPVGPALAPIGDVSRRSGWRLFWGAWESRVVP